MLHVGNMIAHTSVKTSDKMEVVVDGMYGRIRVSKRSQGCQKHPLHTLQRGMEVHQKIGAGFGFAGSHRIHIYCYT